MNKLESHMTNLLIQNTAQKWIDGKYGLKSYRI